MNTAFSNISKRTLLSFGVFMLFVTMMSIFLVNKATRAVDELEGLSDNSFFLTRKSLLNEKPNTDIVDWHLYRNEKYGFEIRYPKEFVLDLRKVGQFVRGTPKFNLLIYDPTKEPSINRGVDDNGITSYEYDGINIAIYPVAEKINRASEITSEIERWRSREGIFLEETLNVEGTPIKIYGFSLIGPYTFSYFAVGENAFVVTTRAYDLAQTLSTFRLIK